MNQKIFAFTVGILIVFLMGCSPPNRPTGQDSNLAGFQNGPQPNPPQAEEGDPLDRTQLATVNTLDVDVQSARSFPQETKDRAYTALGDPNAPVTIVEYSDFQCPFCRRHHLQTMPLLQENYIDQGLVYYVFKDFPIEGLHPLAYRLHEAALCAGDSGGAPSFWNAHDLFFEEAERFQLGTREAMDQTILTAFEEKGWHDISTCLLENKFQAEVNEFVAEGRSLGVSGTPSFFINGQIVVGALPFSVFEQAINQALDGVPITAGSPQQPEQPQPVIAPTPASIPPRGMTALGDPAAPVTIVEYSDFQCPFCRRHFLETMPLLKANLIETGRVYYVFKDYPIETLHPLAYRLHEGALCAGDIGGSESYWEAHDLFFSAAETFDVETLEEMDKAILDSFTKIGLPDISACLSEQTFADEVVRNFQEGAALRVSGTPAFFINGYPVNGAQPYDLFEYAVSLAEEGNLADAYQAQADPPPPPAPPSQVTVPLKDEPFKGDPNAPITIVEYSDYLCPFCARHFQNTMPVLQTLIDGGQVRYLFKDFPLLGIHPQAQKAHEGARCAGELGGNDGYWLMHDVLFENQQVWGSASMDTHVDAIKSLAAEAGFASEAFDECLDSGRYEDDVSAEVEEGIALGISGTPTFFINGNRLVGAQPASVFSDVIDDLLEGSAGE